MMSPLPCILHFLIYAGHRRVPVSLWRARRRPVGALTWPFALKPPPCPWLWACSWPCLQVALQSALLRERVPGYARTCDPDPTRPRYLHTANLCYEEVGKGPATRLYAGLWLYLLWCRLRRMTPPLA
jgi:hypothetical protein